MEWSDLTISKYAAPLALALCGGAVRFFTTKTERSLGALLVGLLMSGFTGALVYCFTSDLPMSELMRAGVIGLSGYAAGDILPILADKLRKKFDDDDDDKPAGA